MLQPPPLTTLRVMLLDAAGHAVRDGVVAVRATGSPDLLASGWSFLAMDGPPEGSAWRRDPFLLSDLGPGTFDLVWLPPGSRTPVCVRADLVVGVEGGTRDLGILRLPPPCALAVRVVDADGATVSGAVVTVARPFAGAPQAAKTDRVGIARLRLVDSGPLFLEATEAEGRRGTVRVEDARASPTVTIRVRAP